MPEDKVYTETMAKIYADQGLYADAAKVYRRILEDAPHRTDIREALDTISQQQSAKRANLAPLFDQWFQLMFSYNHLKQMKSLRKRLIP